MSSSPAFAAEGVPRNCTSYQHRIVVCTTFPSHQEKPIVTYVHKKSQQYQRRFGTGTDSIEASRTEQPKIEGRTGKNEQ